MFEFAGELVLALNSLLRLELSLKHLPRRSMSYSSAVLLFPWLQRYGSQPARYFFYCRFLCSTITSVIISATSRCHTLWSALHKPW